MGVNFNLNLQFSISTNYTTNTYLAPFNLTIYKCQDPHCSICSFDLPNILTGSWICLSCDTGYSLYNSQTCFPCGDGILEGSENCDAGTSPGCLSDCSGAAANFNCTVASPSICVCDQGFKLQGSICS